jgi:phosphoribosylpyrophosphate synthetase
MRDSDLVIFALNASRRFAEAVSRHLGLPLAPHEEQEFEDGEHKIRPLVSVRGKDVFVIQSMYGDWQESVHDKLCRCLFFILERSRAGKIAIIIDDIISAGRTIVHARQKFACKMAPCRFMPPHPMAFSAVKPTQSFRVRLWKTL